MKDLTTLFLFSLCFPSVALAADCGKDPTFRTCDVSESRQVQQFDKNGNPAGTETRIVVICKGNEPKINSVTFTVAPEGQRLLQGYPCGVQTNFGNAPGTACNSGVLLLDPCPEQ